MWVGILRSEVVFLMYFIVFSIVRKMIKLEILVNSGFRIVL